MKRLHLERGGEMDGAEEEVDDSGDDYLSKPGRGGWARINGLPEIPNGLQGKE